MLSKLCKLLTFKSVYSFGILSLIAKRAGQINPLSYLKAVVQAGDAGPVIDEPELFGLEPHLTKCLKDRAALSQARRDLDSWESRGIKAVFLGEPDYPTPLLSTFEPPISLFCRGRIEAWKNKPLIAMVGSRKADGFGTALARDYAGQISLSGNSVVSGLAFGIDAASHRGALESKAPGSTIAVLGSGLQNVYPRLNERLAQEIVESEGLLLSQFEPDEPPYPSNFLKRNSVIAAMAAGVLVIQAGERSGSLVTARCALEEGRELLVVPGGIENPLFKGSNALLKKGAHPVTSIEDVFEIVPLRKRAKSDGCQAGVLGLSGNQQRIVTALRAGHTLSEKALRDETGFSEIAADLTELELKGIVSRLPGNQVMILRNGGD